MKILTAYRLGLQQSIRLPKLVFILYAAHLLLALTVAWPFGSLVRSAIGDSLSLNQLLSGYDHTVWSDFFHTYSSAVNLILGLVPGLLIAYALVSVFMTAGTIVSLRETETAFRFQRFMQGGTIFFWRILRVDLLMLLVQLLISALLLAPFVLSVSGGLRPGFTDLAASRLLIGSGLIILLVRTLIVTLSDYARIHLIAKPDLKFRPAVGAAGRMVFTHLGRTWGLFLFHIVVIAGLICIYLLLEHLVGMRSAVMIWVMFVIQQLWVFCRIGFKVVHWASANRMYEALKPV